MGAETGIVDLGDGRMGFRKAGAGACLRAEALGLAALAATGTVRCPEVLSVTDSAIVTRYIAPGAGVGASRTGADGGGWRQLGRELAALHSQPVKCFGFTEDNFCGPTPQPNPQTADGFEFFAEHRLLHQTRLAVDAALLSPAEAGMAETLAAKLPDLLPLQSPALIHGDLWGGNVLFDESGAPWLIDPAAHWGWPEAELAMTRLFGPFGAGFYADYQARRPLHPGWEDRCELYNLYHLLNHLNIFGGSYHGQVARVLKRFS